MTQPIERPVYPFTAIVGQPRMTLALLLHAVNPALGGVLIRGKKGTAKSTAVRALAGLLPEIDRVRTCIYGCDPWNAASACDDCRPHIARGDLLPRDMARVPVVELPIGATEDRIVGSLDLESAIQSGRRSFEPGLLARANRGILYMDEVNLLGDHLVDLLLDAAAMGRNYVEREGVSVSHPAQFMLVGTMNPEEGELRPQLLDRFALAVEVENLVDPAARAEAVRRRIAFDADPFGFIATCQAEAEDERGRLGRARTLLPRVTLPPPMLELIVHLCVAFDVDGLRADLAMHRAATTIAAYRGRLEVGESDVREAAELVLPHRRRRQPFEEPGLDPALLDQAIEQLRHGDGERNGLRGQQSHQPPASPSSRHSTGSQNDAQAGQSPSQTRSPTSGEAQERWNAPARPPQGMALPMQPGKARSEDGGRRRTAKSGRRGATVRAVAPSGSIGELALGATLAAAAPHQAARRRAGGPAVMIHAGDLRERVRSGRSGTLVLFVVDASGSMGARERMAQTKGAVMALLLDAYRKRDQVGMITFRGGDAELVLPPTNSVDLAERHLRALATGGRTPLAAGLELGRTVVERELRGRHPVEPLLVLVSDGRANSAPLGIDPWQAARQAAVRIRSRGWRAVVVDTEQGRSGAGFARTLAGWLDGSYLRLDGPEPWRRALTVD
jgi:magnesium chelatase subunit D